MQLTEVFYFTLFSITVTATCAQTEHQTNDIKTTTAERLTKKHLSKRDSEVIIENYPLQFTDMKKPKVIYRRISKQRFRASKPKYGPPKPKYGVTKKTTTKKPFKKYKIKKVNPNFALSPNKRHRSPKPRRLHPTVPKFKPKYNIPKHITQQQAYFPDSSGFGEPPQVHMPRAPKEFDLKNKQQTLYAEPPVDSYGAPLKATGTDTFATHLDEEYVDATVPYDDKHDHKGFPNYHRWQDVAVSQEDNNYAYSNKQSAIMVSKILNEEDADLYEDLTLNSYSDIFKYNPHKPGNNQYDKNVNNEFIQNSQKYLNKPWKITSLNNEDHDQIIVGGQYAEPPGRVVPKGTSIPSIYFDDDQIFAGYVHPDTAPSATMSSYVNYKNSNMAFSPQNLNDAFGIVEK